MAGIIGKPYSEAVNKQGSDMHGPSSGPIKGTLGHFPDKAGPGNQQNMKHPDLKALKGRGLHDPMLGG